MGSAEGIFVALPGRLVKWSGAALIAVSELSIQLGNIKSIRVSGMKFEPVCWRNYQNKTLKPDLYAITSDGEYEDHWFFEFDLATEAPSRIVSKCEQYQEYYNTGAEGLVIQMKASQEFGALSM